MSLFTKPIHKEISLPFIHDCYGDDYKESLEAGLIDIEAYGSIDGMHKYLYSSFSLKKASMYDNGDYEQMLDILTLNQSRQVLITLKYKKDRLVDFKLSLESLAKACDDSRFLELELIASGINDTSCKKIIHNNYSNP